MEMSLEVNYTIDYFNEELHAKLEQFRCSSSYAKATFEVISSFSLLSRLLDNPVDYGFREIDVDKFDGKIWEDGLIC